MADPSPPRLDEADPTTNGNGNASPPQQQAMYLDRTSNSSTMVSSSNSGSNSHIRHRTGDNHQHDQRSSDKNAAVGYLSTAALEQRLRKLKDESNAQSQLLTQKLAESQSGQNLLHMSTRLSTLPPLLHSLLQQLHPVLSSVEHAEKGTLDQLQRIRHHVVSVRIEQRRASHAVECSNLYRGVLSAERVLQQQRLYLRDTKANKLHNGSGSGASSRC
jgi:hypothetical protein